MKENQDYIRDIAEMRSMMERSSKFMSLSGLAAICAGIYALAGAWIAYRFFDFRPDQVPAGVTIPYGSTSLQQVMVLAIIVLVLAIGTAVYLSYKKSKKRREKFWNPTTGRLVQHMAVPLVAGGLLMLVVLAKGDTGLVAPLSLVFYGLALFNASKFTYEEVKSLGMILVALGLAGSWFTAYGLIFWALGFGVAHIIYGFYLHFRYER